MLNCCGDTLVVNWLHCVPADTTRPIRGGEETGREYHFVTKELFEYMVCNHRCVSTRPSSACWEPGYWLCHRVVSVCMFRFVEYGEYKGHLYGTSTDAIEEVLRRGQMCIIDVEPHVSFSGEPTCFWLV